MLPYWQWIVGVLTGLMLAGCDPLRDRVEDMAMRELRCPEDTLEITEYSHGTYVVRGCAGTRRIYQCHRWDQICASLSGAAERRFTREYNCAKPGPATELSPYIFGYPGATNGRRTVAG